MTELIERVKCKITITLNDNTEIDISLASVGELQNITNYVTSIDIDESTNTQGTMPVGVVSSNTMKIVLNSNDRSLFPENKESAYYGKMDNTATVKVTLEDIDGTVEFNTYYITKWVSNITSNNPNQVIIEASDLLGIVYKNTIPNTVIKGHNLSTKDAFIFMINSLNNNLNNIYNITYDESELNFKDFDKIEYENIDADNMSDWLNTLSQSTLTNIYIGRDNKIKTDNCLDDTQSESVCKLSDKVNITSAKVNTGGLVNYDTVKCNYFTNDINPMGEITQLNNQLLKPGNNIFESIEMGKKVFSINAVKLISNTSRSLTLTKLTYDRKRCSLEILNPTDENLEVNIVILGQTLKENKHTITQSKGQSNETLEVNNKLILPSYANKYTTNLLNLVGLKNSSLQVTGLFNPRIQLGNTVNIDVQQSIKTSGFYKIMRLQWKITNTIKCTADLIKTIT